MSDGHIPLNAGFSQDRALYPRKLSVSSQSGAAGDGWFEQRGTGISGDFVFCFLLFIAMLFAGRLGTYSALLFVGTFVLYAWLRREQFRSALRSGWLFLVFPAFAVLSTLWSDLPSDTLKHSLEYFVTIAAALLVARAPNRRGMILGIFAALALQTVLSLALGSVVEVGNNGALAFSGLSGSKNEQAESDALGFLVSTLVFCVGLRSGRLPLCGLAAAVGITQLWATAETLSSGALAALAVAVGVFVILIVTSGAGRRARLALISVGTFGLFTVASTAMLFNDMFMQWLTESFNKDPTLTGRTYLWERAQELISDRPFLGRGFSAFWQQGNLDAEGLWQFAHIASREGFNFHSTVYDIAVGLGFVGLLLFAVTLLVGLARIASNYIRGPSSLTCLWLSISVYLLLRMPIETMGAYEFDFTTVLLFASFACPAAAAFKVPTGLPEQLVRGFAVSPATDGLVVH